MSTKVGFHNPGSGTNDPFNRTGDVSGTDSKLQTGYNRGLRVEGSPLRNHAKAPSRTYAYQVSQLSINAINDKNNQDLQNLKTPVPVSKISAVKDVTPTGKRNNPKVVVSNGKGAI